MHNAVQIEIWFFGIIHCSTMILFTCLLRIVSYDPFWNWKAKLNFIWKCSYYYIQHFLSDFFSPDNPNVIMKVHMHDLWFKDWYFRPRISKIYFKGKYFMLRVRDKNVSKKKYLFKEWWPPPPFVEFFRSPTLLKRKQHLKKKRIQIYFFKIYSYITTEINELI